MSALRWMPPWRQGEGFEDTTEVRCTPQAAEGWRRWAEHRLDESGLSDWYARYQRLSPNCYVLEVCLIR